WRRGSRLPSGLSPRNEKLDRVVVGRAPEEIRLYQQHRRLWTDRWFARHGDQSNGTSSGDCENSRTDRTGPDEGCAGEGSPGGDLASGGHLRARPGLLVQAVFEERGED